MNSLEYLLPFKDHCDFQTLVKLKQEKEQLLTNPVYQKALKLISGLAPVSTNHLYSDESFVEIGKSIELSSKEFEHLKLTAEELIPWKKGPFKIFDLEIDGEWRSDYKWNRIKDKIGSLKNKVVLDIGCNNGHYMFKMLKDDPQLVLGIDPVIKNLLQFNLCKHFVPHKPLHFELFGIEHLPLFREMFDTIFSMGIIYHHKNPIEQLFDIKNALKPGGEIILETLGIPGEAPFALTPESTYAKMKNVWFVPTINAAINWLKKAKFTNIEIISNGWEVLDEQRNTPWSPAHTHNHNDFINPNDSTQTSEGYPAPIRFCLRAKK